MKRLTIVGIVATVGMLLVTSLPVSAEINEKIRLDNATVGLAMSPMSSERFKLTPGSVYDGRIRIRQTGQETNNVFAEVTPLSFGRGGDYETWDTTTTSARTKITEWITLGLEKCDITRRETGKIYFTMRPKEECFITYHVAVPMGATGGAQHAAIAVQDIADDTITSTGIVSQYRIGYLVTSHIDGPEATYEGRVIENNIPWLFFDPPVFTTSKVENFGNSDIFAKYTVDANNIFSGVSAFHHEKEKVVMAESIRPDKVVWEGAPMLGIYKVTQTITILGETYSNTQTVIIFPIWLILIIVIIIVLLVISRMMKSREKKRNRQS